MFGFDPEADYAAIVSEARGRRVFPASPESSLLVGKATGRLPHGGGKKIADTTKGQYFEAQSSDDLARVYNSLSTKLIGEKKLTEIAAAGSWSSSGPRRCCSIPRTPPGRRAA